MVSAGSRYLCQHFQTNHCSSWNLWLSVIHLIVNGSNVGLFIFFIIVGKKRTPSCVFVGQRYINRYFKITTTLIVFRMIYDPIRVKRNEQKLLVRFNFHFFVFLPAPMATSRERSLGAAFSPTRSRSKNCTAMDLLVQRSSSSGY